MTAWSSTAPTTTGMLILNVLDGFEQTGLASKKSSPNPRMNFNPKPCLDDTDRQLLSCEVEFDSVGHRAPDLGVRISDHLFDELDVGVDDQPADRDRGISDPCNAGRGEPIANTTEDLSGDATCVVGRFEQTLEFPRSVRVGHPLEEHQEEGIAEMPSMTFTNDNIYGEITEVISGIFPGEDLDGTLPDEGVVDRSDVRRVTPTSPRWVRDPERPDTSYGPNGERQTFAQAEEKSFGRNCSKGGIVVGRRENLNCEREQIDGHPGCTKPRPPK